MKICFSLVCQRVDFSDYVYVPNCDCKFVTVELCLPRCNIDVMVLTYRMCMDLEEVRSVLNISVTLLRVGKIFNEEGGPKKAN